MENVSIKYENDESCRVRFYLSMVLYIFIHVCVIYTAEYVVSLSRLRSKNGELRYFERAIGL